MKNLLLTTGVALLAGSCHSPEQNKPNLLFIMMDDLGYGHFAANNDSLKVTDLDPFFVSLAAKWIEPPKGITHHPTNRTDPYTGEQAIEFSKKATPTLSMLAKKGAIFTSAYASNNLSAPSRLGIATGMYPSHFGVYENADIEQKGLTTGSHLAEKLQEIGYATAHIGKWHIGKRDDQIIINALKRNGINDTLSYQQISRTHPDIFREVTDSGYYGSVVKRNNPLQNGFEYYFGYNNWASQFYNSTLVWNNYKHAGKQRNYNTDVFTDTALSFISRQVKIKKPFYVQLHFHAVHDSLRPKAPEKYFSKFPSGCYDLTNFYAHVYGVDSNIKRIMDYLESEGVLNNTIIVFTSDNGAQSGGPSVLPGNAPFYGFKATYYQGGIRVPLLFYWPDKIKKPVKSDLLVSSIDILPTLIDAAGGTVPGSIDGKSLLPVITGQSESPVHDYIYWAGMHSRYWGILLYKTLKNDPSLCPGAWAIVKDDYLLRFVGTIIPDLYTDFPDGRKPVFEMYNIKKDPSEKNNIIDEMPEKANEMKALYYEKAKDFPSPVRWNKAKWKELLPPLNN